MITAIILAAGKGTRLKSKKNNKVTLPFAGKPLIVYGVELLQKIASPVVVVIGAFSQSVRLALKKYKVVYAFQRQRLGTGHAVRIGLQALKISSGDLVLVGYGDHLMFYSAKNIEDLISLHRQKNAAVSLISTIYPKPDVLAWGRIIRDKNGFIKEIVEQKDASPEIRKIKELNAGFCCFDGEFLKTHIRELKKSPVSGEYYLTDMIKIATEKGRKVAGLKIPFSQVGPGINQPEELEQGQKLFLKRRLKQIC